VEENIGGDERKRCLMQKTRSFKKSFNRWKTKSGQAADSNVKKYKYEEVLRFLEPHIHERYTISSIEQPSENDSDMVNSQVMASADDETCEEIIASNRNADIHQPENQQKKREIVLLRPLQVL
jgi:hypothetical protein